MRSNDKESQKPKMKTTRNLTPTALKKEKLDEMLDLQQKLKDLRNKKKELLQNTKVLEHRVCYLETQEKIV